MASRRTRIKGIANIPQRRKTTTTIQNSEEPTLEPQRNLTSEHVNTWQSENSPELSSIDKEVVKVDAEKILSKVNPEPEQKLSLPLRRKFIKPTVSLNAVNRKTKGEVNAPNNNKIVVLDEVITYPEQNQPVFITDHKEHKSKNEEFELGNNLLKLTGITAVKADREIKRPIPQSQQLPIPENEYPIPPPSPNKVNRSRIKAIPRLGQRNTSFSASESEDESRRNYRHRNDSVCSTTSGYQDNTSIAECLSPQKPKEFNSVIQRKCRRTEQSRKLAEARRDFYIKFGNKKPDRQKLTMIDLIFYNPTTNLMSHESKQKREEREEKKEDEEEKRKNEEKVDDPGSDEENEIPAPQIKIGPEGEIVVDEQSLVIENKAVKKNQEELAKSKVIDGDLETGYGVYKRAKRSKDWSKNETLKFYKALNTIGTDFTLMCELFPRRSRRELKMKFKKEEKINKTLIDRAIMQPCGFDFNDFKHEVEMEEKELMEIEQQREKEKQMKKEAKKRKASSAKDIAEKIRKTEDKPEEKKKKKPFDISSVLDDDDSDADESEIESVNDENDDDEDDIQNRMLENIQKPTRSGRVPKILDRYKAPDPEPRALKAKPGSLIVVAETGANGEPVYKVCMVTAEQNRKQIGQSMTSLSQALECQESGYIKNLFTLSSTSLVENNETIPVEECNVTIPAEENLEGEDS